MILGVVVLAITGGEAKYADIGHFMRKGEREVAEGESVDPRDSGRRPVMFTWFFLVLPCLVLNYAGQVGYILEHGVPRVPTRSMHSRPARATRPSIA